MSYEGRTSYAPRTFFRPTGQATSAIPINSQMNCKFFYLVASQPQQVKNPFNASLIKLMPVVSSTYPDANAFSLHLEGNALGSAVHISGWAMWKTNKVVSERYAPPLSVGFSNVRYITQFPFLNGVDATINTCRYAHMEF